MYYESEDGWIFDEEPEGKYVTEVEFGGWLYGYASFDDDRAWEYEHTAFVVVPRDLICYDIDTVEEDGTSLFKNGAIVYDSANDDFIYPDEMEPSLGSRYIGVFEGSGYQICDYFDFNDSIGIYALVGD